MQNSSVVFQLNFSNNINFCASISRPNAKPENDYGTVAYNSDGRREFVFTNNGNKPLIITNVQSTCGCTVPTYPKEPIAPGAKGVIGVKYDTSRAGQAFTKTVTLTTNAVEPSRTLTIKGNVLAADATKS